MKKKKLMAILMGCVALIFSTLMFTQIKTVDKTDITAIETMRETELRTELANWKAKYEEIENQIEEKDKRISEYNDELNNDATTSTILENEVKEAETYLGYTTVQGQGIVITLSDNDEKEIEYSELLRLVNELNGAGAEAISINGERIVSTTEIALVSGRFILVNMNKLSSPYVVKAIGDKKYLESALSIKGGFLDELKLNGKTVEYTLEDNVEIQGYNKELEFKYAEEYKEQGAE